MKNKKTAGAFNQIAALDLDAIVNVNDTPQKAANVKEGDKNLKSEVFLQKQPYKIAPPIPIPANAKSSKNAQGKNGKVKQISFNCSEEVILKFRKMAAVVASRHPVLITQRMSAASVFSVVIHAMEKDLSPLLSPSVNDIAFYTNNHTRHKYHVDKDIIENKKPMLVLLSIEDYSLVYKLMHTFYTKMANKPTRYSVSFFFFEIVRYMEAHLNDIADGRK